MIRLSFFVAVVVLIVVLLKKLLSGVGSIFDIHVKGRTPTIHGTVPGRSMLEVRDFLSGLQLPSGSRITGYPDGRRFRLEFNDKVPEGTRQRIRNFFFFGL